MWVPRLAVLYRQWKQVSAYVLYTYFIKSNKTSPREIVSRFVMLQKSNSGKYEFIRKVFQSSHGSKVYRFVPWTCPCSAVLGKRRTQSVQDEICGTLLLCSDLQKVKCKRGMLASYQNLNLRILKILNFKNLVYSPVMGLWHPAHKDPLLAW